MLVQYNDIHILYELFASLQDSSFKSVQESLAVLEFFEQLQPLEKRRLSVQNDLVKTFGNLNENGVASISPSDENYLEFVKAYNELQLTTVDVQPPRLSLDSFSNISPNQLKSLLPLLTII